MCRNTNTHEIENDADEPSPEVTSLWKKFGVWMFMTLSAMVTEIAPRSTTYFQNIVMGQKETKNSQSIVMSQKFRKVARNIETGQNSGKVVKNNETGQNSASHHEHRDGL